jgi:hypothetical protein
MGSNNGGTSGTVNGGEGTGSQNNGSSAEDTSSAPITNGSMMAVFLALVCAKD